MAQKSTRPLSAEQQARFDANKLTTQRCKAVSLKAILDLFPEYPVKTETKDKAWVVSVSAGLLHVSEGKGFNLNFAKGQGWNNAIDLYQFLSTGTVSAEGKAFLAARDAIAKRFGLSVTATKADIAKAQRIVDASLVGKALAKKERENIAPKALPPRSEEKADAKTIKAYLTGTEFENYSQRALHAGMIEQAMIAGAIYPCRVDPNVAKFTPKPTEGGRKPYQPLNVIFGLLDYQTDKPVAYAKRGVGGSFKLNIGPKATSSFRTGAFDSTALALVVTESPIEALSFYTEMARRHGEDFANQFSIHGLCGANDPTPLLEEAKKRGINCMISSFNNDAEGRAFNRNAMEAATKLGMKAGMFLPAGEITLSVYTKNNTERYMKVVEPLLAKLKEREHPVEKVAAPQPGWAQFIFPNTEETCTVIKEINKSRIGYYEIKGEGHPLLEKARDELVAIMEKEGVKFTRQLAIKEDGPLKDTWVPGKQWGIIASTTLATEGPVKNWIDKTKHEPPANVDRRAFSAEFSRLIDFDFAPKDLNELCVRAHTHQPDQIEVESTKKFEPQLDIIDFIGYVPKERRARAVAREKGKEAPAVSIG